MKSIPSRLLSIFGILLFVAACSLPRGAALKSEISKEARADLPSIQIIEITRGNVPVLNMWPATGQHGHYHWLDTHRAPASSVIRPGDHITLTIWDTQENSLLTSVGQKKVVMEGLEVSPGGSIFVPYIEDVRVAGLSESGARRRIQQRLEPIVPSAQVQLSVAEGIGNSVDIVSGVPRPGTYPMPGRDFTILSALSQAGGISATLRNPIVKLLRGSHTYTISAQKLFETSKRNTVLVGGDKIIVEQDDRSFTALGASGVENVIYFPKDEVTAIEALSLMGGLVESRADPEGILVLREYATRDIGATTLGPTHAQVVFTIDLTSADGLFAARKFLIQPGDTVLATESPVTTTRAVFGLVGTILGLTQSFNNVTN